MDGHKSAHLGRGCNGSSRHFNFFWNAVSSPPRAVNKLRAGARGAMMGCTSIFITYAELNMIHIVGYLTVNTLFTVLHSIEKTIAFLRIIRDLCDI